MFAQAVLVLESLRQRSRAFTHFRDYRVPAYQYGP